MRLSVNVMTQNVKKLPAVAYMPTYIVEQSDPDVKAERGTCTSVHLRERMFVRLYICVCACVCICVCVIRTMKYMIGENTEASITDSGSCAMAMASPCAYAGMK